MARLKRGPPSFPLALFSNPRVSLHPTWLQEDQNALSDLCLRVLQVILFVTSRGNTVGTNHLVFKDDHWLLRGQSTLPIVAISIPLEV